MPRSVEVENENENEKIDEGRAQSQVGPIDWCNGMVS
jgi:hypothetical protein